MIAPAPWPELNLEPFPDTQTQRLAAWQAVGTAQQILPEREPCCASGRLLWGIILRLEGSMYVQIRTSFRTRHTASRGNQAYPFPALGPDFLWRPI